MPGNLSLVTLQPYAPELNPLENVWAYLRGNKLAITVFDNYEAIVTSSPTILQPSPQSTSRGWAEVSC